jgi:hypothetical protein
MLRRVSVILLAFAFVVGLTAQVAAGAWTMHGCPMSAASMGTSSQDSQSDTPCNGLTPACMDSVGCAVPTALPVPQLLASTMFEWVAATFTLPDNSMSGLSVEPDLTPPILRA